jgi:hypothetical protein
MYPPTKDEQIVNTALVHLLNALAMYQNLNVSWTIHRIPLRAIFDPYSFEARTDGYLSDGQGNPLVLIEVKPVRREDKLAPIRMQESAQMVAWIKAYEDGVQDPRKMYDSPLPPFLLPPRLLPPFTKIPSTRLTKDYL